MNCESCGSNSLPCCQYSQCREKGTICNVDEQICQYPTPEQKCGIEGSATRQACCKGAQCGCPSTCFQSRCMDTQLATDLMWASIWAQQT